MVYVCSNENTNLEEMYFLDGDRVLGTFGLIVIFIFSHLTKARLCHSLSRLRRFLYVHPKSILKIRKDPLIFKI